MHPIGYIRSPFVEKFGVPRQSGLVPGVICRLEFEPPYRHDDYVRGLADFSHLWLIWGFHCHSEAEVHPTVRPPRLGGNARLGVFATRSPYRPNGLGLSAVRLLAVESGPSLLMAGGDMVDGTPVYDIKPYLAYADAIPEAEGGFTTTTPRELLSVRLPAALPGGVTKAWLDVLRDVLSQDPRPAYQCDPDRVYHMVLRPFEVDFNVQGSELTVLAIRPEP